MLVDKSRHGVTTLKAISGAHSGNKKSMPLPSTLSKVETSYVMATRCGSRRRYGSRGADDANFDFPFTPQNGPAAAPIASFGYETVLQEDVGMQ